MDLDKKAATAGIDLTEPKNCLCAALGRAQRNAHRVYETALKLNGVTPAQFTILTTLRHIGETTISNLAKSIGIDRTTLTRTLVPLVRAGWVADQREDDQRVRRLDLTGKGAKIQATAARSWQQAQVKFIATMGEDNAGALLENLRTID